MQKHIFFYDLYCSVFPTQCRNICESVQDFYCSVFKTQCRNTSLNLYRTFIVRYSPHSAETHLFIGISLFGVPNTVQKHLFIGILLFGVPHTMQKHIFESVSLPTCMPVDTYVCASPSPFITLPPPSHSVFISVFLCLTLTHSLHIQIYFYRPMCLSLS